jgi:hypothetical protein
LEEISKYLDVPKEIIVNFNAATILNNFYDNGHFINNQFNPLDKIVELYEKMLLEKQAIIDSLKKSDSKK